MITSNQIRAARALLRWSTEQLATHSGVGSATIKRFEAMEGIPSGRTDTLANIYNSLKRAGVVFIGDLETNPGVQLDTKKHQAYLDSLK